MTSLPASRPVAHSEFNPWLVRLPVLTIVAGILLMITLLGLIFVFQIQLKDRFMPGVSIYGIRLDGLTREQAEAALAGQFTFDDRAVFTFRDGEKFWQYTAGELGVRLDPVRTLDEAFAKGRGSDPVSNMVDQTLTWLNGAAISPVVTYDQSIAVAELKEIAEEINRPAIEGSLMLNGTEIVASTGQSGRAVDITATLAQLETILLQMNTGAEISLVIRETPPTVQGVELAESLLRAALSGPVTLTTSDLNGQPLGPWTLNADQIAGLLKLDLLSHPDGRQTYEVSVDLDGFESYLNELAPGLITQPVNGRFHFNQQTKQLEVIKPAIGGRRLNVQQTIDALEQKVFSLTERTAQMAFDYVQPRYHNNITAAELGITEMVVDATTYYAGSTANRRTNIAVGAALYDGIIIGPGEEFSFNYWLGDLSEEAGFTEGNVIYGGRTTTGIGGGICQVSTTIFRAAFYGGYKIIERNAHGYRVGYYEQNGMPPGMDAAIWTPERDFRFQNDTPHHLLIEVSIYPGNDSIQFRFFSTGVGRQVEVLPATVRNVVPAKETSYEANDELKPGEIVQVDYSAEGADVNIERIIRDVNGEVISTDNIFTHYLPWGAIYQVAPGDVRLGQ